MEEYRVIRLRDIDLSCDDFRFSFSLSDSVLESSVSKLGVMQPVVVMPIGDAKNYKIVSGFKRLYALRKTSEESLTCRVISSTMQLNDIWFYIANDNLFRKPTEVEKSSLIAKAYLASGEDSEWVILNLFPVLGLERSRKILEEYLVVRRLVCDMLKISHEKSYPLRFLVFLSGFSSEEQSLIVELFSLIPCGYNKVSSLLLSLREITLRDNISLSDVLGMCEIREILTSSDVSPSKRGELLKFFIRGLRFPSLLAAENSFANKGEVLCLAKNVAIFPPKHMEGKNIEFRVSARSSAELLQGANSLTSISSKFDIDSYFFGKKLDD